jgi:hypothetical protein
LVASFQLTKTAALEQIIDAALAKIGASRIPVPARQAISADVLAVCAALIKRRITGEYVGKMVAVSLTAATQEGLEGEGTSPSTSQPMRKRSAQMGVAGPATNPLAPHDDAAAGRRQNDSTGSVS